MTALAMWALGLGVGSGALGAALVLAPRATLRGLAAFPRNRMAGWLLSAVALAWCGSLLYGGPLGFLAPYRRALFVLVPGSVVAVGLLMDDLLAPRALGGLLILAPAPILAAARWHQSPWHFVMSALAYVLVVVGCVLVMTPYQFRRTITFAMPNAEAGRRWGVAALVFAVALIALALGRY